ADPWSGVTRHVVWLRAVVVRLFFFFSSRRRHTRLVSDWSSDVCSSDLCVVENRSMNCSPCWTPDRGARINFRLILGLLAYSIGPVMAAGSSKPDFGPNVLVFNSSMAAATMQDRIDKVYATQQNNQFGPARNALLFAPGDYKLDIPIGYYTQVLGLGASPDSVHITGNVHSDATLPRNNATCTFWKAPRDSP